MKSKPGFFRRAGLAVRAGLAKAAQIWKTTSGYFRGWWASTFHGKASYDWLARNGYMGNEVANRAINMIAGQVAGIFAVMRVFFRDADGKVVEDARHAALDLIRSPNPRMGLLKFIIRMCMFLYLDGNVYVRVVLAKTGEQKGQPVALFLLQPNRVEFRREAATQEIIGYRYTNRRGITEDYSLQDVRHVYTVNPLDDERGFPLLGPAVDAIEQMGDASSHNRSLLKLGGRHAGFFVAPNELGDDLYKRTKKEVQDTYQADAEAGLPGLLEAGMKFEKNAQTNAELDFNNSDDRAMKKVAITAGIDPALIGDSANKTYSNFETAIRALVELTAIPFVLFILGELNPWLFRYYPDSRRRYFGFKDEDIKALQEKPTERYTRLEKACGGPFLSPNEARSEAGVGVMANTPSMDVVYRAFNQIPITDLLSSELSAEERHERIKNFAALRGLSPSEVYVMMGTLLADGHGIGGDGQGGLPPSDSFA